jgi:four helix bundle protein
MGLEFQLLTLATDLASEVFRRTASFPQEEQYVMVPMLRDDALSVIENTALGMAGYHPIDRFRLLIRSRQALEDLHGRLVMCRTINLLSPADLYSLETKYDALHKQLVSIIEALQSAVQHLPPSSTW